MRHRHTLLLVIAALCAATVGSWGFAAAGASAQSSHDHSMPGMTAEEHAQMSAESMGMTAEEHAQMSDHGDGHAVGPATATSSSDSRPVALILGFFGLVIALLLVYAAVIRRRPESVKRRETLARVRAAGTRTD